MGTEYTDETLTCVQCGTQFVFSAQEQELFKTRGLSSPPKRCKQCRKSRRRPRRGGRRGTGMKDYRAPGFQDRRDHSKTYRSPAFADRKQQEEIYRGPAFQQQEQIDEIYRAPAFRDDPRVPDKNVDRDVLPRDDEDDARPPVDQARPQSSAAADEEYDLEQGPPPYYREPQSPDEIYRSPSFRDSDPSTYAPSYKRREMHEIVCDGCGRRSRVPFKPQKDKPVYCKDCYGKKGKR